MALGGFWDRIRSLYRKFSPQVTRPTRTPTMPTTPRVPQVQQPPTVPPAPTVPPVGPLDPATVLDTIVQAGRSQRMLQITYDGVTRMVEPYSMRNRGTGDQLFGWCSIHGRIHSFIPAKISAISITDVQFSPRWPIEL